jgi:hypothetical protein
MGHWKWKYKLNFTSTSAQTENERTHQITILIEMWDERYKKPLQFQKKSKPQKH